jgi:hypothetical protein
LAAGKKTFEDMKELALPVDFRQFWGYSLYQL